MKIDETEWELIVAVRDVFAFCEDTILELDPDDKQRVYMTQALSRSKDLLIDYFLFLIDHEQFADNHIKPALLAMVRQRISDN